VRPVEALAELLRVARKAVILTSLEARVPSRWQRRWLHYRTDVTLPHVELWNVWYRDSNNSPAGLEPIVRDLEAACRKVGRDPATLEKTSAVLVRLPGGTGRVMGDTAQKDVPPIEGSASQIAARLREYADLGLAEVQLVVDPITIESIRALAPVLAELDRG